MKRRRRTALQLVPIERGEGTWRTDLGAVVSRYIDETQNSMGRLFEAAEKAGDNLFFDEADALFGKRSASRRRVRWRCLGILSALVAVAALAYLRIGRGAADRSRPFPRPSASQGSVVDLGDEAEG
jgi:hypothetical protein